MTPSRRLGAWSSFACRPLLEGLDAHAALLLDFDDPAHTSFKLRDGDLDVGFVSTLDYARESSNLVILPGVGLWSETGGNAVTLHFRTGLHDVSTLAVDPSAASEVILASIILGEEFDVTPQIVPVQGGLEEMLSRADAALLVGDAALRESARHAEALDLVESWVQLTGQPFIHGFWCARPGLLTPADVEQLQQARRNGVEAFTRIAEASVADQEFPGFTADHLLDYLERFSYDLPEEALEGIKEFHHYAFYHGALPDIPELQLFDPDEEAPPSGVN